jgi:transposase
VTETGEDEAPHLITPVETTAGPVSDGAAIPHIHQALARQGLLPATPIVDTGDLDAAQLVTSLRQYRVDRTCPRRADGSGPAQAAHGCDVSHCRIDGEPQQATCPGKYTSVSWNPAMDGRTPDVVSTCSSKDCQP